MKKRKIKFRGICNEEIHTHHEATEIGEWIEGYLVSPNTIRTTMSEEHGGVGSGIVHVDVEVLPETVSQYIGLKDKKGTEVYDGSIYKNHENGLIGLISFQPSLGGDIPWTTEKKKSDLYNYIPFHELDLTDFEVIGNIHDNPDLLK